MLRAYSEVEKRKKGEVSLNALATEMVRAKSPITFRNILVWHELSWMVVETGDVLEAYFGDR